MDRNLMLPSITDQLGFPTEVQDEDGRVLVSHNGRWDLAYADMMLGSNMPSGHLVNINSLPVSGGRDIFGRIMPGDGVYAGVAGSEEVQLWLAFKGDKVVRSTLLWNVLISGSNAHDRAREYARLDENDELLEGLAFAASTLHERVRAGDPHRDWSADTWRAREEEKRRRKWELLFPATDLKVSGSRFMVSQGSGKVYMVHDGQAIELGPT